MKRAVDPGQLLLTERRQRVDRVIAGRSRSLIVVLEEVHDPHNIGAVLRTCECFGLQELHVVEGPRSPYEPAPVVTQGAEKWIDVRLSRDIAATCAGLRERGYRVLVSRLQGSAIPLPELPATERLALVFGNEHSGVSDTAAAAADGTFVIPMVGFTQSLNISVAVGVSVSWLSLRRAQERGKAGDLDEQEAAALRERFYVRAVKQRGRIFGGKATRSPPRRYRQEDDP